MPIALSPEVISNKPEITSLINSDLLLVSREINGTRQLNRISKNNLTATLPLVPIGTITIWAGTSLTALPLGYRICDGSSLPTSVYPDLFSIIGYNYTRIDPVNHIDESVQDNISVFKLPNLSNNSPIDKLKFIIYTGRIA
jgi:hypothetical protein